MVDILSRLRIRRDSASLWGSNNPVLGLGEPGFETDQARLRIGNGSLAFASLRAFLSVPTSAINVAQAFLNATTKSEQRDAIGITGDVASINALGTTARLLSDWEGVHALGTGFYRANAAAANSPTPHSYVGNYTLFDANNGVLFAQCAGGVNQAKAFMRRYTVGSWEPWVVVGGESIFVDNWNNATQAGFYYANDTTTNGPTGIIFTRGIVMAAPTGISQLLFQSGGDDMYFRRWNVGTGWTAWLRLLHTDNLTSVFRTLFPTITFTSSEQTITPAGSITVAHGLGRRPETAWVNLICKTAEHGYSVGEVIMSVPLNADEGGNSGVNILSANATNLMLNYSGRANPFIGVRKTDGATVYLTNARWRAILGAI